MINNTHILDNKKKIKYIDVFILFFLLLPLFFLNINNDHSWGDDFAQYLKQAQNISNFTNFSTTNYIYNKDAIGYAPPYYPPIYSLILAPVLKYFGIDYEILGYCNTLILLLFIFSVYFFYIKQNIHSFIAIILSVIVAYNPQTLDMKISCLSEFTAGLFLFLYLNTRDNKYILSALFAVLAFYTRSIFVIIFLCEFVYFAFSIYKKDKLIIRSNLKFIGSMLFFIVLFKIIFFPLKSTNEINEYAKVMDFSKNMAFQFERYINQLRSIVAFKVPDTFHWSIILMESTVIFCVFFMMVNQIIKNRQRHDVIMLFNFIIICAYNIFQDFRYLYPFLPLIIYYLYVFFIDFYHKLNFKKYRIAIFSILLFLVYFLHKNNIAYALIKNKVEGVMNPAVQKMFSTINIRYAADDVFCFLKPRALALYTHVKTIHYPWSLHSDEQVILNFKEYNVRHVLLWIDQNDFMSDFINRNQKEFYGPDTIEGYVLYTYKDEMSK